MLAARGRGESVLENEELPGRHLLSHSGLCNREGARARVVENGGAKTRFSVKQSDPRFDVLIVSCSWREKVEQKENPGPTERAGARGWYKYTGRLKSA